MRFLRRRPPADARSARLRPAEHVARVQKGGRSVLLDMDHERYFGMDEVGTRVWELLREGLAFEAIVVRLTEEYDAPRERIETDVEQFLGRLLESRLVEGQ